FSLSPSLPPLLYNYPLLPLNPLTTTQQVRREQNANNVVDITTINENQIQQPILREPYMTRTFDSHINVEVCSGVRCVKYIHQNIYRGT
ncbi:hypothetical protein GIB67_023789, partial [Kingdonia uniflora]